MFVKGKKEGRKGEKRRKKTEGREEGRGGEDGGTREGRRSAEMLSGGNTANNAQRLFPSSPGSSGCVSSPSLGSGFNFLSSPMG